MGLSKGISGSHAGRYDQGSIHSHSQPWTVGMPPEGSILTSDGESIGVTSPWANGALGYKFRSIGPPCEELAHSVPANIIESLSRSLAVIKTVHSLSTGKCTDTYYTKTDLTDLHFNAQSYLLNCSCSMMVETWVAQELTIIKLAQLNG